MTFKSYFIISDSLGRQLRTLNQEDTAEESLTDQSTKIIKLSRNKDNANDPRFSEGLKASRDKDGSSRLVQNALKGTIGSNDRKRNQGRNEGSQNNDHKRQRVVRVEGPQRGYVTSHGPEPPAALDPQAWMNAQAQQNGFSSVEEMMAAYFQKNMLAMMQNMGNNGVFPLPPNAYHPNYSSSYNESYHYPSPRGRGRSGRSFRAPVR